MAPTEKPSVTKSVTAKSTPAKKADTTPSTSTASSVKKTPAASAPAAAPKSAATPAKTTAAKATPAVKPSSTPSTATPPAKKLSAVGTSTGTKKATTSNAAIAGKKATAVKKGSAAKGDGATPKKAEEKGQEEGAGLTPEEIAERERRKAEEMEDLRQKAWLAEVEFERKQEAKRRQQQEEEARRRREAARLTKALLEAAFDGEVDSLQRLLKEGAGVLKNVVDTSDNHNNTLLSEAAAGGDPETVRFLLSEGANPNSKGEFGRTPLWRACFLGKEAVVLDLLRGGGDPRIGNEGGELPVHVAASQAIKDLLSSWDTAETDRLASQWQAAQEARRSEELAAAAKKLQDTVEGLEGAQRRAEMAANALRKAHMELEKRIHEYDTCVVEQKPEDLTRVALQEVKDAEGTLAEAKARAAEANEQLQWAKLQHREEQLRQESEGLQGEGAAAAADLALVGISVEIRDLDDVLIKDVGGRVEASGKWPLVIDTSGQASVFLRYADSNYVSALSQADMQEGKLRKSLLGAIRYGKPFVLDFMAVDLFDEAAKLFDKIQPGLMDAVLTKSLLQNEAYLTLIRPEDGEEYDKSNFQEERVKRFKCIFLTSQRFPNENLVERTYPLRVKVKGG